MPWTNLFGSFKHMAPTPHACFIVGASGQVGTCLLDEALGSNIFTRVVALVRTPLHYTGPNRALLDERVVPDFDALIKATEGGCAPPMEDNPLAGCPIGFVALGTTRALAGSAEAFRHVDHDYVLAVARLAKAARCRWLGVVSSAGANASSPFVYLRVKGELEASLSGVGLDHVYIYRPAHILCGPDGRPRSRRASRASSIKSAGSSSPITSASASVENASLADASPPARAAATTLSMPPSATPSATASCDTISPALPADDGPFMVEDNRWLERIAGRTVVPLLDVLSGGRLAIPKQTIARVMFLDAVECEVATAHNEARPRVKIASNRAMIDIARLEGFS